MFRDAFLVTERERIEERLGSSKSRSIAAEAFKCAFTICDAKSLYRPRLRKSPKLEAGLCPAGFSPAARL
jgi:hypothetical protein